MTKERPVKASSRDGGDGLVHLHLNPLASLIVRTRWFRNLTGLTVQPVSSVWRARREPQDSNLDSESGECVQQGNSDELRIIRRNALASALMKSAGRWGR